MINPQLDISSLTLDERLSLMDRLWESLQKNPEALCLSREQEAELDRRIDEVEQGETGGASWEAIRDSLRNSRA